MYLKRVKYDDGYHYVLRATYREEGLWKYRELFDLGISPYEFIVYPGGNGFYFKPEIEEALNALGVEYSPEDLDEVFMPFLDSRIRRIIERARHVHRPHLLSTACPLEDLPHFQKDLHPFDIRRLHYLKFGHIDMGNVETERSWRFLKVLSCKCRDEIEATFDRMERRLPPKEFSRYLYTALHLQTHFQHHILRDHPVGLKLEDIDTAFIEELCRLNRDEHFFRGVEGSEGEGLHPYLKKYVWLYFDHDFEPEHPWQGFFRDFRRGRPFREPVSRGPTLTIEEAYALFGITQEKFAGMERKDLVRLYRRRAKKTHPDKGGNQEDFVLLTEAYELLAAIKG